MSELPRTKTNLENNPAAYLLASSSKFRADLLRRLNRPFIQFSPDVDESQHPNETPSDLANRLALSKANAPGVLSLLEAGSSPSIVIASDQVVAFDNELLGKPGTTDRAYQQLRAMRGRTVSFYTALHMKNHDTGKHYSALDITKATLRELTTDEIERYVEVDDPLQCAGSFKVESLGISLFDRIESLDPTALIGLPMISVSKGLRNFGLSVP